jgi:protease I
MKLKGKKIGILLESDFYEHEIWYYKYRFPEEGAQLNFLTKLWGQSSLTFKGHEYHAPFECHESFEDISDEELETYSAIIVPAGMVSDRLRWTEEPQNNLPSACQFLKKVFANKNIIKGVICHGMWLISPIPEVVKGRKVTCHNNLYSDVVNMGAIYTDEDVVVDDDLVTARSGGHAHVFAKKIIEILASK